MQSKQSVWPTLVCIACLIAAAATICLQKRSQPLVTASISQTSNDADPTAAAQPTPAPQPHSVVTGTDHQIAVYKNEDGYRCTVKDLNGKQLAPNLTLKELGYEYPELHKMVKSKLSE